MTTTIHGNTVGLSPAETRALERVYRRRVPFDTLLTPELVRSLCDVSCSTGRQVGVLLDRGGTVTHVVVGDAAKLVLPDLGRFGAAAGRFRGLRLVHTHLRSEPLTRDDLVDLTRLRLDLVAAVCVSPDGRPLTVCYAHGVPANERSNEEAARQYGPIPYAHLDLNPSELITAIEEEFARVARRRVVQGRAGRAILVQVCEKRKASRVEESLRELRELSRTAGVEVADAVLQVRDRLDPKYLLGRGKLEDVLVRAMQLDVDLLIFDRNLAPNQAAAIAALTDLKVIDRTQLILDIFAQRAESRDGKLQVELAQMRYLLPRLGTRDDALSRLTGGIGGRGPGETKLEIGKRRARERIAHLEEQLGKLARQREQRRGKRGQEGIPVVAIVGYTNAGKSTLLNALTGSDVLVEDKLFATLDTRTRRLRFPEERDVVLTDTVGFIRDMPRDLLAAFRATFEEAQEADLLLHVVDASDPAHDEHSDTTIELLVELGIDKTKRIVVFNKADRLEPGQAAAMAHAADGVAVSAVDPQSLWPLLGRMEQTLWRIERGTACPRTGPAACP